MRFEDLNWMDIERYLETDQRVILISGATEQHAYNSLLTDILIPTKLADAVAARENVLIAPPLTYGVSPYFMAYPGTISLSQSTFDAVMIDVVYSLIHHGFSKFFVLNGHGGNTMPSVFQEINNDGAVKIDWYDWWKENGVKHFEAKYEIKVSHANWGENFPFNRVAEVPSGAKPTVIPDITADPHEVRQVLGDGSYGGPYQIADDLMSEMFAIVVEDICIRLRRLNDESSKLNNEFQPS